MEGLALALDVPTEKPAAALGTISVIFARFVVYGRGRIVRFFLFVFLFLYP
jgi:hypothetical protein